MFSTITTTTTTTTTVTTAAASVIKMGKDVRAIFARRHSYATKSNKTLKVKTPGGSLVLHKLKKRSKGPRCGETGAALHGVRF